MDKKIKEVKNIKCDCKNCVFHTVDSRCMAGTVEVGTRNASVCGDTVCATFEFNEDVL
ncbi:MAG: DUF1540 domain-containing protein [Oscillospiraceae bacterium]|nr:DUF1540 domain-containing protein [Oscillospiraceae bacterium]